MLAKLSSLTVIGLEGALIDIEVDIHRGLPRFSIVGLGDTAIQESKERIRSALKNSGFTFPKQIISVNLAPADIKKYGPRFDLPIALGILESSGQIQRTNPEQKSIFLGELNFQGEVRPISGILPLTACAKEQHYTHLFLPKENEKEAAFIPGIQIYGVQTLSHICQHLEGREQIPQTPHQVLKKNDLKEMHEFDMSHIKGNENAKRALCIAAAGGHNMLMSGPPGSGKSMLAKSMATILPKLNIDEALEVTKIHSIAGKTNQNQPIIENRPFRSIHHTASSIALVGGGNPPSPGEISLAHKGVLFIDELGEFPQRTLDMLRQPLEDGKITISRISGSPTFPCQCMLIAATNPTPCGYESHDARCTCSASQIQKYQNKISGPILDRIDLRVHIPHIPFEKLNTLSTGESSESIREKVEQTRDIQRKRFKNSGIHCNAEMSSAFVKKYCPLSIECQKILETATHKMNLSGRSFYRIVKVSQTIADLENEPAITPAHIAEALSYR